MRIAITMTAEMNEKVSPHSIVELRHEENNPHDPNAIQAILDGETVGYVIHNPKNLLPGEINNDRLIKTLRNPKVAGCNARLLSSRIGSDGMVRWNAEAFPIPKLNAAEKEDDTITLTAGGSRVLCANMATVLTALTSSPEIDVVLALNVNSANGAKEIYVWQPVKYASHTANARTANPCGIIQDANQVLLSYLDTHPTLDAKATKVLSNNTFAVETKIPSADMDVYDEAMVDVVKRCVLQMNEVKERVGYLTSQCVPKNIIEGVLKQLKWRTGVVKPTQLYLQTVDKNVLTRSLGYYLVGKNIRLIGEKGAGKNTLVSSVCWVMNQSLCRMQGNADTDKIDLLGGQTLDEKGTKFELSTFVKALSTGSDAVLDEVNAIKPEIAIALHSLADDARSIDIPGYGLVTLHPDSHIWGTMNVDYVGTGTMNPATVDRFVPIFLTDHTDLVALLTDRFPDAKREDIRACSDLYTKIVKAVRDGNCTADAVTVRGYMDAIDASVFLPMRDALLDNIAGRPQDTEDRNVIRDFICAAYPA